MKFSVVTPVKNGERFIRQTIASVLSQEGDFEIEYFIRDGLSEDNTLRIANEYADDPRVVVVSEKDRSMYDAINRGFEQATGDIGCWLNADDWYEPGAFQKVVNVFNENPEVRWLYGRCDIVDQDNQEIRRLITKYKNLLGWRFNYSVLLCENYINQMGTFWKMDLWREIGGASLDYRIAEDYHLWLKMGKVARGHPVHEKLAHFRRCGESMGDCEFELQFQEDLDIAKRYAGPLTLAIHRFNNWKIVTAYKFLS